MVQGLGLHASIAGVIVSALGWGTKIPHAMWCGKKKKNYLLDFCAILLSPLYQLQNISPQSLGNPSSPLLTIYAEADRMSHGALRMPHY